MKLNQKLIQQLRSGKIAAENNGTLEQLTEVLKEAFPIYHSPCGGFIFYSMNVVYTREWIGNNKTTLPVKKISDFYQPELFTGWVKDDNYPNWMVYFDDDLDKYGFDCAGVWIDGCNDEDDYSKDRYTRPATNKEIETTLIEEAKRRGYKGGNTIKGIHDTTHFTPEISSFTYEPEYDRLLTDEYCVVYEAGQWAEIVEQPEPNPIHYLVDDIKYSFNYQELKEKYQTVVNYSDEQFMDNLPEIAHLACIVSFFKGLSNGATIGDKGIIHDLIHLMVNPSEPTNDLAEIREKFNRLIKLV